MIIFKAGTDPKLRDADYKSASVGVFKEVGAAGANLQSAPKNKGSLKKKEPLFS